MISGKYMTENEFWDRFIDTTNALRLVLNEPLVTRKRLERVGCRVQRCNCSDPTCPGWGMTFTGEVVVKCVTNSQP